MTETLLALLCGCLRPDPDRLLLNNGCRSPPLDCLELVWSLFSLGRLDLRPKKLRWLVLLLRF